MRKRKWIGAAGALFAVSLMGLCGCSSDAPERLSAEAAAEVSESTGGELPLVVIEPETAEQTEEADALEGAGSGAKEMSAIPDERVPVDGMIQSYLTGEMVPVEQGNRRPLAVMMSNDKAALPQYGINRAGVVYEAPVEGTMNRYMAIIEDYDDLDRIGSVRSCRTYYTYFAREFDAVYAHYGQSTFAKPYLKNVDNINGLEGVGGTAYYRSNDKKAPHNAYTSAAGVKRAVEKLGYSLEYDSGYQGHFQFTKGEAVDFGSLPVREAYRVTPGYRLNEPWFEYHEDDGLYYRYQYGAPHNGNEGQIAVKNLLIQYCPAGYYATTEYRNINVHDDSWGYYVTDGKAIDVTWKKDGEFGVTHYYDENGDEITLNPGKTWICICTTNDMGVAQFAGR